MTSAFFLGGRRGTRTPNHFVKLTGESKNVKMLEFPLNQLQTYYGYLCDLCPLTAFIFSDLNYKMVIFLSQTESTLKHFFKGGKKKKKKKALDMTIPQNNGFSTFANFPLTLLFNLL
jgi:hypothetical protein